MCPLRTMLVQGNWVPQPLRSRSYEIDTNDVHSDGPGNAIAASQGDDWIDPKYDAAGNMSQAPVPGAETTRQHYKSASQYLNFLFPASR
ncbi:MAG: hypothetical protein NTY65_00310 [Planctomycetota bacterium]|nr:hypothetical protein [Planctomycetota bacterium]